MKYRYYYDAQGTIIGFTKYKTQCYAVGVGDSIGYIDSDTEVDRTQYKVDLTTLTLVENNQ